MRHRYLIRKFHRLQPVLAPGDVPPPMTFLEVLARCGEEIARINARARGVRDDR